MANISIVLDTRRPKCDNKFPVYMRLTHKRQCRNISTRISIPRDEWNYKKNCIKSTYPNAARMNLILDELGTHAQKMILDHQHEIESMTINEVKALLTGEHVKRHLNSSLFKFGYELVERYKQANKIGSAAAYKCCLSVIQNYREGKDISLKAVNYQFLLDFEAHLLGKGVRVNSIGGYMRHLRSILNQAIANDLISPDTYPFKKFRIKKERTAKRAISKKDINKVINCEVGEDIALRRAKHYFTFMFHARGMNFVDLAHLKVGDISNGRLIYRRQKTGKLFNIKLTDTALEIISQYAQKNGRNDSDYIFPIIASDILGNPEKEWLRITDARKLFNINLKKLARLAGLDVNLTSYVVRHSWASIAKFSGISTVVIGESLGHSDLKTTETYLAEFEHDVLDKANELIVG